jgi:hypothetical protein
MVTKVITTKIWSDMVSNVAKSYLETAHREITVAYNRAKQDGANDQELSMIENVATCIKLIANL